MINRDTSVGQIFAGKVEAMTMQRIWAFSGGPFALEGWPRRNLHTDPAVAERVGLPAVAVSATQYQGLMVDLLVDLFGEQWLRHGTLAIKFPAIVTEGDQIEPKVAVRSKEVDGDAIVFNLDVWCENQDAVKVLVGTATGRLKQPSAG